MILEQFAAIDLGSNSFHLVVVREEEHGLKVIDRQREMVRLAAGLNERNKITKEARDRALECVARFGQRLRGFEPENVRIVGTNALRKAINSRKFIRKAEQLLGYSIEIISGVEEARLIYLGVAQTLQGDRGRRLVVDIGGGSTEIIVGDQANPVYLESFPMGCVSGSEKYFADGIISERSMRQAILVASLELEPNIAKIKSLLAKDIIGTSGTAREIENVVRENAWSETGITPKSLGKLVAAMVKAGHVDKLDIAGLGEQRRPVFAGGVAVMKAIFETFDLEFMRISEGALREGVLHDLIGRVRREDRREITVSELMKRHHIDTEQAGRVRDTTMMLFKQIKPNRLLKREGRLLGWAAQLHEIGLMIAHSQHHIHGSYVLRNMDLPGFSRQEQEALSIMVGLQRRKYNQRLIEKSAYVRPQELSLMSRLLRISVLLHRSRIPLEPGYVSISIDKSSGMHLEISQDWLHNHPLTAADLEQEVSLMAAAGIELQVTGLMA